MLDPVQHARMLVAAYPAAPDLLAMGALLADQGLRPPEPPLHRNGDRPPAKNLLHKLG